jgi:ribonucleotide monophosphatase NagD (HAD superfamily)
VTRLVRGLAELASGYRVILSDVWGVVHNGLIAFEKAAEALGRFRAGGGKVVLMTNSPNPSRFGRRARAVIIGLPVQKYGRPQERHGERRWPSPRSLE